ncbi:MAG: lmo0937 family membrane protein [Gemmatimonadaceae bacterium]
MLWTIAVVLFILWLLGWLIFPIVGGLIHVLLVVAIIVVIFRLITGRRPVV